MYTLSQNTTTNICESATHLLSFFQVYQIIYLEGNIHNHTENSTVQIFFLPNTHMGLHMNYKKS